jgi:hypothetical protein
VRAGPAGPEPEPQKDHGAVLSKRDGSSRLAVC